jgi:riboflavin synthase
VSLTVVDITDPEPQPSFTVSLIPTTLRLTTLGLRDVGDTVNLEVDVVAKYVERLAAPHLAAPHLAATHLAPHPAPHPAAPHRPPGEGENAAVESSGT